MYVKDTVLSRTVKCENHEHLSSNDFPCPPSWLWIWPLSYPLLSVWPFLHAKSFLFFSLSFQFVPNSLFKKEKLAKNVCLNTSENHKIFFLNRCVIKYYAISNGHMGVEYREIQEIGAHRRDLQTLVGTVGSETNICSRWKLPIFWCIYTTGPTAPTKVSNQEGQRHPTGSSQTLVHNTRRILRNSFATRRTSRPSSQKEEIYSLRLQLYVLILT